MVQHPLRRWAVALGVVFALACVDGDLPTGIEPGPRDMHLAIVPQFSGVTSAEDGEFTLARLTVLDEATEAVLGVSTVEIDPTLDEWTLDAIFEVGSAAVARVVILIELLSVEDGVETVEWSGETDGLSVAATSEPQEVQVVDLFPGPADNLDVSSVTIESEVSEVVEGDEFQLTTTVVGGGPGVRVQYASRDPSVARIDATGFVQTLARGTAVLVAAAGPAADSVVVDVTSWPLPPQNEVTALMPGLSDGANRVLPNLGDESAASAVAAFLAQIEEALGQRRGLEAFRALESAEEALAGYGVGTSLAITDGPDVSVVGLVLLHVRRLLESLL